MSEMHESQLHDWLAYRDQLARRLTVPDRVVRNVEALTLERPVRGIGRGRLLLMAAAVAALLFAGIGLPHVLLRSQPGGVYDPAAPPSRVPNRVPPTGIALVWVADPANPQRIIALDRDGHAAGWLPQRADGMTGFLKQSGDGQRLLLDDGEDSGTMEITAQGRRIPLPPTSAGIGYGWNAAFSDDDRSVCIEQGAVGTPRTLVVADPSGRAAHTIAEAPADNPAYLSWHVVTCSVRNDLAVLIGEPDPQPAPAPPPTPTPRPTPTPQSHNGTHIQSVSGLGGSVMAPRAVRVPAGSPNYVVRVVRLSTGAELVRRVYGPSSPQPVDASTDGTLVLERNAELNSYTVRDVATGTPVGSLHADVRNLLGNHLAIVQGPTATPTGPVAHLIEDVRTGAVLWETTLPIGSLVSYPGDGAVAITVQRRGDVGWCPSSAAVDVTDLATGSRRTFTLDTCPPR